jgi:hypothetical protein
VLPSRFGRSAETASVARGNFVSAARWMRSGANRDTFGA